MSALRPVIALSLILGASPMTFMSSATAQSSPAPIEFVTAQPTDQHLARVLLGAKVINAEGATIGDVYDLMFDKAGKISTAIIGVGGFLGMGEKLVAVPYAALAMSYSADGTRTITLKASKDDLKLAPTFTATEKTVMDAVRDKAIRLGQTTADKANELKDQAAKKIDDMTKGQPANK